MNDFSKRPRWHFAAAALLLTAIALWWALCSRRFYEAYQGIPSQTAVLLEFRGAGETKPAWLTPALPDLSILHAAKADAGLADGVLRDVPAALNAFQHQPLLAAFSLNPADSLHALFIVDLGQKTDASQLVAKVAARNKVLSSNYKGQLIFTVHLSKRERLVLATKGNLLFFSRFSYLVEDALVQAESRKQDWKANMLSGAERDAAAVFGLTVRTGVLAERLRGLVSPAWSEVPEWLAQRTEWFSLVWNGKSWQVSAGLKTGFNFINNKAPVNRESLFQILPDNTAFMAWTALDTEGDWSGLMVGQADDGDFRKFIWPWVGKEAAFIITEPYSADMLEDQFILIRMNDSARARVSLQEYGARRGLLKQYDYQTFEINQYLSRTLIAPLIRGEGSAFQNPVSALIGSYVVFAATPSALELFIDKYIVSQTLMNAPDFLPLSQKLVVGGNPFLFFNFNYLPLFVKNLFGEDLYGQAGADMLSIRPAGLTGLAFEEGKNNRWRARVLSQAVSDTLAGVRILWKTGLESNAVGPPSVVRLNAGKDETAILIQDDQNQLYRFSAGGAILWRKKLEQPVLSTIYGIDYYRNGRLYYLFNTANAIWILDDEGRELEGFPLKLQSPATNGVTVVDFDNARRYTFFIACANGNLYGFDPFGRPVSGWNPRSGVGTVPYPLVHFKRETKDYLAVLGAEGRLSVFNRNGSPHFSPVQLPGVYSQCPPQIDGNPGAPRIVGMNDEGRVSVCNPEGKVFNLNLAEGGRTGAGMVFEDFAGDDRKDFVVFSGNHLRLTGYQGAALKTWYSVLLPSPPDTIFKAGCCHFLGALNLEKRQIFLVDAKGNLRPGFPLAGTTPFVLDPIFPNRPEQVLIVGNGNAVYAYKIN